jgi:hypothetical protein
LAIFPILAFVHPAAAGDSSDNYRHQSSRSATIGSKVIARLAGR